MLVAPIDSDEGGEVRDNEPQVFAHEALATGPSHLGRGADPKLKLEMAGLVGRHRRVDAVPLHHLAVDPEKTRRDRHCSFVSPATENALVKPVTQATEMATNTTTTTTSTEADRCVTATRDLCSRSVCA